MKEDVTSSAMPYICDPDAALVAASIDGDIRAFETLVKQYSPWVLRIAQQITHNLEDAQEAAQEAFFNAYQKLSQFQGDSKFTTWLIRIAINESLLLVRRRRRRIIREVSLDDDGSRGDQLPLELSDWHPNPERMYQQAEFLHILRKGLVKLSPALRVAFVLRDIEGLSIAEVSAVLNVAPNAVKVRVHRARLELRETLSRYFGGRAVISRHLLNGQIPAKRKDEIVQSEFFADKQQPAGSRTFMEARETDR